MSFPLFSVEWGADEELLLVEAIEIYGLGNWGDVADHVGTKSKKDCEVHYEEVYMKSATAPMPDMSKVLPEGTKSAPRRLPSAGERDKEEETKRSKRTDSTSSSTPAKNKDETPSMAEQAGYHEKRREFETEWNNDIECQLKDLVFLDDDTEQEFELKMRMLEMYNRKLEEREFRRDFVIERGFVSDKKQNSLRGKLSKGGKVRELYDRLRVVARLMPHEEWKEFMKNVIEEAQIRTRIRTLQKYRRLGIHTRAGAQKYEREKKNRQLDTPPPRGAHHAAVLEMLSRDPRTAAEGLGPALLARMPGVELLSAAEAELCSVLVMAPEVYAQCKEILIVKSANKHVSKSAAQHLLRGFLDATKAGIVHEFCQANHWINRTSTKKKQ